MSQLLTQHTPFFVKVLAHGDGRRIDAIKLFALACMIGDHFNTIFCNREIAILYILGRLAFPLFAVVFGFNLARNPNRLQDTTRRTFIAGVFSQPFYMLAFAHQAWVPWYGLNILFAFGAAGMVLLLWRKQTFFSCAGAVLFLAGFSVLLEPDSYGLAGLVLILSSYYCSVHAATRKAVIGSVVWWTALLIINRHHIVFMIGIAFLVWIAINLCVLFDYVKSIQGRFMPRRAFYWIYGGHLALLWGIAFGLARV